MGTTISNSEGLARRVFLKQFLLTCGIIASLLYGVMMIAIRYEGYSLISQAVSELTAIGTPTRSLWIPLGWIYTAFMIAFGFGVWISSGNKRPLQVVAGLLLFTYGLLGFIWPFASMHQREVLAAGGGTASDTLHLILSGLTVLGNLAIVGFGAFAFGKRFRLYSLVTFMALIVFGTLTGLDGPGVAANVSTPLLGLWERIIIMIFLLWLVVMAVLLIRKEKKQEPFQKMIHFPKQPAYE